MRRRSALLKPGLILSWSFLKILVAKTAAQRRSVTRTRATPHRAPVVAAADGGLHTLLGQKTHLTRSGVGRAVAPLWLHQGKRSQPRSWCDSDGVAMSAKPIHVDGYRILAHEVGDDKAHAARSSPLDRSGVSSSQFSIANINLNRHWIIDHVGAVVRVMVIWLDPTACILGASE
jgi:hypothetical protein